MSTKSTEQIIESDVLYQCTKQNLFEAFSHYAFMSTNNQPYNENELDNAFEKWFVKFKSQNGLIDYGVIGNLYEFIILNKNGMSIKSIMPCDNDLQALKVQAEVLKSKNVINIEFKKYESNNKISE